MPAVEGRHILRSRRKVMDKGMARREFLGAIPLGAGLMARAAQAGAESEAAPAADNRIRLEAFEYRGVRLLPSRWLDQVQQNRDYYFALTDDDILKGFRAAAGLPAPGTTLGGWCERDSSPIFGQWLSGMARLSRAMGDSALHA